MDINIHYVKFIKENIHYLPRAKTYVNNISINTEYETIFLSLFSDDKNLIKIRKMVKMEDD